MSTYLLDITLTNEDEGYQFSQWTEDVEDWLLRDDGTPDFGKLYREVQREYGRCQSSVYRDRLGAPPRRVGWYFVKRAFYDGQAQRTCQKPGCDNPKHYSNGYLQGAWVTVAKVVEEARPRELEAVEVTR